MNEFASFWIHSTLATAIISWVAAQGLKIVTVFVTEKRFDFKRFVGSGGMPSSHSAVVCSLACGIGLENGFRSPEYAIAVVLAMIVMYDAAGVRRAAGQQAKILNELIYESGNISPEDNQKKLKELLGHTPKQVFFGALLGIAIALIRHI